MCDAPPPHDGTPPPPGETWCPTRLALEAVRGVTGQLTRCGIPRHVTLEDA